LTACAEPLRSAPREAPQAVVRVVPKGGARTAAQICAQWKYLAKKGEVSLQRSERHLGGFLPQHLLKELAQSWAVQTGSWAPGDKLAEGGRELTTHIVVSFPVGSDLDRAFAAGRAWAEEMFGSGKYGGHFDYLTACHSDRPHPHVHLILNRRAFEGHWLKISRRHEHLNYNKFRATLVAVANLHGIGLQASSRAERGLIERPPTYAAYRRQMRLDPCAQDRSSAVSGDLVRPAEGGSRRSSEERKRQG
jgi:type IV secretion system T-DNA border endonuclease VirD2